MCVCVDICARATPDSALRASERGIATERVCIDMAVTAAEKLGRALWRPWPGRTRAAPTCIHATHAHKKRMHTRNARPSARAAPWLSTECTRTQ